MENTQCPLLLFCGFVLIDRLVVTVSSLDNSEITMSDLINEVINSNKLLNTTVTSHIKVSVCVVKQNSRKLCNCHTLVEVMYIICL